MTKIRIEDTRNAGYCVSATKVWFSTHGFDFKSFVRDGIDYDLVKDIDDVVVGRSYKKALEREKGGVK